MLTFDGHKIKGLYLADDSFVDGDIFIETTGTTGPMGNCLGTEMDVQCVF